MSSVYGRLSCPYGIIISKPRLMKVRFFRVDAELSASASKKFLLYDYFLHQLFFAISHFDKVNPRFDVSFLKLYFVATNRFMHYLLTNHIVNNYFGVF